jgi:hypothetical protein
MVAIDMEQKRMWRAKKMDDSRKRDLHAESLFDAALTVFVPAVFALIFLLVALCCEVHAGTIPETDIKEAAAILYGESASDPLGWVPKLNTYHKTRRTGESMVQSMKRVSSAWRTKSQQYTKAKTGALNAYEQGVYNRLLKAVRAFSPDPTWNRVHHENLALYPSRSAAIRHLKKAWGSRVDFAGGIQIGREHYFAIV